MCFPIVSLLGSTPSMDITLKIPIINLMARFDIVYIFKDAELLI